MKSKKRAKASRHRGSHTHGGGFKKKGRGKGNRGGIGMAGSGKRGDQKKTLVLKLFGNSYFGKSKTLRRKPSPELASINVGQIQETFPSLIKRGIVKESKDMVQLNLKGYKILGKGQIKLKLAIQASAASKVAIDKVKNAGGDIILPR